MRTGRRGSGSLSSLMLRSFHLELVKANLLNVESRSMSETNRRKKASQTRVGIRSIAINARRQIKIHGNENLFT
ncbi:hypothetical protein HU200_002361 [Digitaria exilis]|uniref:Uncharacterized protein n=1 Tax=Digitaria exilis TaxID=1010633 RepID=A0A835KV51_9POAL|nr:hypothetical protein HU200_014159 [Digitaria exilis]KAF8779614.1 hypothetical protein HU200_002361 [Digitaria exilis]